MREIRDVLGVHASDNLQHAELILVVEGEEDRRAIRALLGHQSKSLSSALAQGALGIESFQGGSNLTYKLSQMREALCLTHCFLDHDSAGLKASERATQEGLLSMADLHFTVSDGMKESEIEDLYDESLYAAMLLNKYGVSTQSPKFKGTAKWSDRLRDAFRHQGKLWSDQIEERVKADVAELVEANAGSALNVHRRNCFDALAAVLESKLTTIAAGKKQ